MYNVSSCGVEIYVAGVALYIKYIYLYIWFLCTDVYLIFLLEEIATQNKRCLKIAT